MCCTQYHICKWKRCSMKNESVSFILEKKKMSEEWKWKESRWIEIERNQAGGRAGERLWHECGFLKQSSAVVAVKSRSKAKKEFVTDK